MFIETSNLEFLYIEVWFGNKNSKPLKIQVTINLVIN